jgi:Flp pilus assembly protein CpaB
LRNKIFTILGILIVLLAFGSYFFFDLSVRENSEVMGINVLIAKQDIPEGTIIRSAQEAEALFGVRKISPNEAVASAIRVNTVAAKADNFLARIQNFFSRNSEQISTEDLQNLTNKRITAQVHKNQQMLSINLSDDITDFQDDERLLAVPINYINSVGGEIKKGDYVDVWLSYKSGDKVSEKVIGPLRVIKLKDANNKEIAPNSAVIPTIVLFKLNEAQIELVSGKMRHGDVFLVKWGITPTAAQLEMAKVPQQEEETTLPADENTNQNQGGDTGGKKQ